MRKLLTSAVLSLVLSAPTLLRSQAVTAPATAQTPAIASPGILPLDQIKSQAQLDSTLLALDTALFDAYNRCDLTRFSSLVADDVEFYHDQGGITLGSAALTESIRKNICGRVTRQLTAGTLKVYPMKDIGAVEMGSHRFFETGNPVATGEADFVHLWLYRNGAWKVSRVLSYNHHAAK